MHFGQDPLILAQSKKIEAGYEHIVLIADLHVMMSHGLDFVEVRRRAAYCEAVLSAFYKLDARYMRGSDFQLSSEYISLLLGLAAGAELTKVRSSLSAASRESARFGSVSISTLLYPLMQILDGPFLGIALAVADGGQKKIYDLAQPEGPLYGLMTDVIDQHPHFRPISLDYDIEYTDLIVDIKGQPLNKSTNKTRLSIHENADSLKQKISRMYAPPAGQHTGDGEERTNALLAYLEFSAVPWIEMPACIATRDGDIQVENFSELERDYVAGNFHPNDLKDFLFDVLNERVRACRNSLSRSAYTWLDLARVRES